MSEGETLRVSLENGLPEGTPIHWHGVPVPNPMDGVPDVIQVPVSSDETFEYEYEASSAGTYVYHSHVGLQLDRGLYGPPDRPGGVSARRVRPRVHATTRPESLEWQNVV